MLYQVYATELEYYGTGSALSIMCSPPRARNHTDTDDTAEDMQCMVLTKAKEPGGGGGGGGGTWLPTSNSSRLTHPFCLVLASKQ